MLRPRPLAILAGLFLVPVLVLLMAPVPSGLPSRPTFQTVRAIADRSNATAPITTQSASPAFRAIRTGAAANEGWWETSTTASALLHRTLDDTGAAVTNYLTVNRSGATATQADTPIIWSYQRASASGIGALEMRSTNPGLSWINTSGGADSKVWQQRATATQLLGEIYTDAGGSSVNWLEVTRSGNTVTVVDFPNATTAVRARGVPIVNGALVHKAADTSRASTTTATDDPDLTVTLASGATYAIDCLLIASSSSVNPDLKFQFTRPTNTASEVRYDTVETAVGVITTSANGGALGSIFTVPLTATNFHRIKLFGKITTTASGTFAISWAQNTSDAAATVMRAGSFCEFRRYG